MGIWSLLLRSDSPGVAVLLFGGHWPFQKTNQATRDHYAGLGTVDASSAISRVISYGRRLRIRDDRSPHFLCVDRRWVSIPSQIGRGRLRAILTRACFPLVFSRASRSHSCLCISGCPAETYLTNPRFMR